MQMFWASTLALEVAVMPQYRHNTTIERELLARHYYPYLRWIALYDKCYPSHHLLLEDKFGTIYQL